jgi:CPA2 family monovalent cation:H+ antiporter-2
VGGKAIGVTTGAFFGGFGIRTAVRAGVSMAQIGEFSFIIAGLGVASANSAAPLYPVAVTTSLLTAFLTPLLVARSDAIAFWVDRRLPHPIQTFASLYGAWMEALAGARAAPRPRAGRLVRVLVLDAAAIAAVIVAVSLAADRATSWLPRFGLPETVELGVVIGVGVLVALPFGFGLVLAIRRLALVLATTVVPAVAPGSVDQGRAPRRALVLCGSCLRTRCARDRADWARPHPCRPGQSAACARGTRPLASGSSRATRSASSDSERVRRPS